MRRGQITIFIIVGIVLLFVLAFAIYMFGLIQHETVIEVTPDDDDTGCLKRVSEYVLLGAASGGSEPPVRIRGILVAPDAGKYFPNPPLDREYQEFEDQLQFGIGKFDPLCLRNGTNRPNASGDGRVSCMPGTYQLWYHADEQTIQRQLENSIDTGLAEANCSVSNARVIFGTDEVTVTTENATTIVPIRFKRLHNAALRIAQQDISDIAYNLSDPEQLYGCDEPRLGNICLLPEMTLSIEHRDTEHVFTITDNYRKINGVYPEFRFTIENRKPLVTEYPNQGAGAGFARRTDPIFVYSSQLPPPPGPTIIVHSNDSDDEDFTVACYRASALPQRLPVIEEPLLRPHIGIACEPSGITITPPSCLEDDYVMPPLFYEACDGGGCANTTIEAPVTLRLATDVPTANYCCSESADYDEMSPISGYPGNVYCCSNNLGMTNAQAAACCGSAGYAAGRQCCEFLSPLDPFYCG